MFVAVNRMRSFSFIGGLAVLGLLLALSLFLRLQDFKEARGIQNLEASYHVLLTVKAIHDNRARTHFFLPTVSLGQANDKDIPWGATVPTDKGSFIYTSFAAPGFLAPYLFFELFYLTPTTQNLAYFNFVLGSIASLALFALLFLVLRHKDLSKAQSAAGALCGVIVSVFSKEALQSQGLVYWHQCLYQALLALTLVGLFKWLTTEKDKRFYELGILTAVFVGAWVEWTGYVFAIGLAILLAVTSKETRWFSVKIMLSALLAGIVTFVHFALAIGAGATYRALLQRFIARSTVHGNFHDLFAGYVLSYGAYLFILAIALICFLIAEASRDSQKGIRRHVLILFIAASIPLLENIVMLEHAAAYSYDRLKFIFPAALLIALSYARAPRWGRMILGVAMIFCAIQGYKDYRVDVGLHKVWIAADAQNRAILAEVRKDVDMSCAVFLSNSVVRGYANLLLDRGIYEWQSPDLARGLMQKRKACAAVYFEGKPVFCDLPAYTRAVITRADGTTQEILPSSLR